MKIPRKARKVCRELFGLSIHQGRLDRKRVEEISETLVARKPRYYLQILQGFTRLVRLEIAKHHAVVSSAVELDASSQSEIESNLRSRFGKDTTFSFQVQPALLGGIRIKLGSDVWDGSIRGRLDNLRKTL
jgi:F-type H+-transporting ATPase subunit delta